MTAVDREQAIASFDKVWKTINDRHYDPGHNGVDWDAVRVELRPEVEAATTMSEARAVMRKAFARLGQSHFGIIPAEEYEDVSGKTGDADTASSGDGETGLRLRVLDDRALIVKVSPGSPAAGAGVEPGWFVRRIDGKPVERIIRAVNATYAGQAKLGGMHGLSLRAHLMGTVGETMKIEFDTGKGRRTIPLTLAEPTGSPANFGNLPTMYLSREARTLPSGVGYLAFSVWLEPTVVMPWFAETVKQFKDSGVPGIILDLRGNPGGLGAMAMGVGNWFVEKPNLKLGDMQMRDSTLKFVLNPRPDGYRGPLAVLVDEMSISTSEISSGGLQAIGRARIFGTPTPGMALPSIVEKLPNGDGFQYAMANYTSADGQVLEGRGVIPDEVVPPDPALLRQGRDTVIEAAEAWILAQNRRPS